MTRMKDARVILQHDSTPCHPSYFHDLGYNQYAEMRSTIAPAPSDFHLFRSVVREIVGIHLTV